MASTGLLSTLAGLYFGAGFGGAGNYYDVQAHQKWGFQTSKPLIFEGALSPVNFGPNLLDTPLIVEPFTDNYQNAARHQFRFTGDVRLGYLGALSNCFYLGAELRYFFTPHKIAYKNNISYEPTLSLSPGVYTFRDSDRDDFQFDANITSWNQSNKAYIHSNATLKNNGIFSALINVGLGIAPCCLVTFKIGPSWTTTSVKQSILSSLNVKVAAMAGSDSSVTIPSNSMIDTNGLFLPYNGPLTLPVVNQKVQIPPGVLANATNVTLPTKGLTLDVQNGPTVTLPSMMSFTTPGAPSSGPVLSTTFPEKGGSVIIPAFSMYTTTTPRNAGLFPTTQASFPVNNGQIDIGGNALPLNGQQFPITSCTLPLANSLYITIPKDAFTDTSGVMSPYVDTTFLVTDTPTQWGPSTAIQNKADVQNITKSHKHTRVGLGFGFGVELPIQRGLAVTLESVSHIFFKKGKSHTWDNGQKALHHQSRYAFVSGLVGLKYAWNSSK